MTRDSFVEHFGEEQAQAIEAAASSHADPYNDTRGSDPFRWAVVIAISFGCVRKFHAEHEITVPQEEFKAWVLEHGDLGNHDGGCDILALITGTYQEYIPEEVIEQRRQERQEDISLSEKVLRKRGE